MNGVFRCFQAYRLEPLICGDYSNIPPVQLHRFDSKQAGYTEAKPSKTGQAGGKWGGLFRVGFSRQKTEEADASLNGEENMDEDDVVVVHNAASADKSTGKLFLLTYGCAQGVGYQILTIYTRNPEFCLENQMVRVLPFGELQKTWAVIRGGAIFLLFLVCSGDLDIHCIITSFLSDALELEVWSFCILGQWFAQILRVNRHY